jgi:hypothetical protein
LGSNGLISSFIGSSVLISLFFNATKIFGLGFIGTFASSLVSSYLRDSICAAWSEYPDLNDEPFELTFAKPLEVTDDRFTFDRTLNPSTVNLSLKDLSVAIVSYASSVW